MEEGGLRKEDRGNRRKRVNRGNRRRRRDRGNQRGNQSRKEEEPYFRMGRRSIDKLKGR